MKIMYRQVQEMREGVWTQLLELEERADALESAAGHPVPLRLRAFSGPYHSQTRVQQRHYDSLSEWARLYEERQGNLQLLTLDAERADLGVFQRDEIYVVDPSRAETPAWAPLLDQVFREGRGRAAEQLERLLGDVAGDDADAAPAGEPLHGEPSPVSESATPMPVMYRQIQEIRPGMWEEQFALERRTDEVEGEAGHPLPDRYRALASGSVDTQLRVHQRVYPSIGAWGQLFEQWTQHEELQELEVIRHRYYTWEREELYYVELPGARKMRWIELAVDAERAEQRRLATLTSGRAS